LLSLFNNLFADKLFYQYIYLKFIEKENEYKNAIEAKYINQSFVSSPLFNKDDSKNDLQIVNNSIFKNSVVIVNSSKNKNSSNKAYRKLVCWDIIPFRKSQDLKEKKNILENVKNLEIKNMDIISLIKNSEINKIIKILLFKENGVKLLKLFSNIDIISKVNSNKIDNIFKSNKEVCLKIKNELIREQDNLNVNQLMLNKLIKINEY
jgi:hypothetical protein